MLSMFKNFFSKKEEKNQELEKEDSLSDENEEIQSIICYYSDNEGNISLDIDLKDYSKETITNFAKIICGICSFRFHIETLEIIKNGFLESEHEEMYDYFLAEVIRISKEDLLKLKEISGQYSEEPCVRPSDML